MRLMNVYIVDFQFSVPGFQFFIKVKSNGHTKHARNSAYDLNQPVIPA
jgi:hypothetical protein